MNIYFSEYKGEHSFEVLLPNISFIYCNNRDGRIYTNIISENKSALDTAKELISGLNPLFITKKSVIILNLLVNPYFEELCSIISDDTDLSKAKKRIIKKHIFKYLGSEEARLVFSNRNVEGCEIYNCKNMYSISNEMLRNL